MNGPRRQPTLKIIGVGAAVVLALAAISTGVAYVVKLDARIGELESQNIAEAREDALRAIREAESEALNPLPVGTIIASVLKPRVFLDGRRDKWHLADASSIPEGELSRLVKQHGLKIPDDSRLPDLRGMFLRGQNDGRVDGKGDPQEKRQVGSYQSAATGQPSTPFTGKARFSGKHQHGFNAAIAYMSGPDKGHERAKPSGRKGTTEPADPHEHSVSITGGGDVETRPGNVSVYFYIKVN